MAICRFLIIGIKTAMNHLLDRKPYDFSLVLGGPLYQFFIRARIYTDTLGLLKRRVLVISLFTWLPLLLLSVFAKANGKAFAEYVCNKTECNKIQTIPADLTRQSTYLAHAVFNTYHSETEMMRYIKFLEI